MRKRADRRTAKKPMKNRPKMPNPPENERDNREVPEKRKPRKGKISRKTERSLRNREIGPMPAIRHRSIPTLEEREARTVPYRFPKLSAKNWRRISELCRISSGNAKNSSGRTDRREPKARFRIRFANSSHEIPSSTASCRSRTKEKTERVGKKSPRMSGGFRSLRVGIRLKRQVEVLQYDQSAKSGE